MNVINKVYSSRIWIIRIIDYDKGVIGTTELQSDDEAQECIKRIKFDYISNPKNNIIKFKNQNDMIYHRFGNCIIDDKSSYIIKRLISQTTGLSIMDYYSIIEIELSTAMKKHNQPETGLITDVSNWVSGYGSWTYNNIHSLFY